MALFTIEYTGNNEEDVTYFADADLWEVWEVWNEKEYCYQDGIKLSRHDREEGIELLKGDHLIWNEDVLSVKQRTAEEVKALNFW